MNARQSLIEFAALAVLLASTNVSAQALRGVVRESASLSAVSGAVVMTLDSAGATLARSVTNERGEFRLPSNDVTRRLRTMRIGYRALELPIDRVPSNASALEIILVRVPTLLDVVEIRGRTQCPARSDGAAAFGFWQQIRSALLSTIVAQEANPALQLRFMFEKTFAPDGDSALLMRVAADSNVTGPASFQAARSATLLVQQGFVVDSGGKRRYFGPDAELLVDDAFMQAYCFQLAAPTLARAAQVGLTFSAPKAARGRTDIRGTLWVDTARRVVRDIEFQYAGVDSAQEQLHPGGVVNFLEMQNGVVLVDRWHIRLVSAVWDTIKRTKRTEIKLRQFAKEVGGELGQAVWSDQTWNASLGSLRGRVLSADGTPAAGTVLNLRDTHYRAVADATGSFVFNQLVPGPYVLSAADAQFALTKSGVNGAFRFLSSRDSIQVGAFILSPVAADEVEAPANVFAALCPRTALNRSSTVGAIVRNVRNSNKKYDTVKINFAGTESDNTESVANIRIVAQWRAPAKHDIATNALSAQALQFIETRSEPGGAFRVCGAPTDIPIELRAIGDRASSIAATVSIQATRRISRTDLQLDVTAPRTATFAGVAMVDSSRRIIPEAEVLFPELGLSTRTNTRGEFNIANIPPGTHSVVARSFGFMPLETKLTFAPNQTDERSLYLHRVTVLDSVMTTADRRLRSFDENRRAGFARFLTRDDLAKLEGQSVASVIERMSGAAVARGNSASAWLTHGRGPLSLGGASITVPDLSSVQRGAKPACYAQVWIDGVNVYKGQERETLFDLSSIVPSEIEALEYYAGSAQTPALYSNLKSTCGVLVIWRRR